MGMPIIEVSKVDRCTALANIVDSIAKGESALANIINAGSITVETVANMPDVTAQELIDLNNSVGDLTFTISAMESQLVKKLTATQDMIQACGPVGANIPNPPWRLTATMAK